MAEYFTVLVNGILGPAAQSIVKGLRADKNFKVYIIGLDVGVDNIYAGKLFADKVLLAPRADSNGYIDFLIEVVKKYNVSLFIPVLDIELLSVSRGRGRLLREGCEVFISKPDVVLRALDKLAMYQFCQDHNIEYPAVIAPPLPNMSSLRFPLFLKPSFGCSGNWQQARRVATQKDLEYWWPKTDRPVLQEYLDGVEYTIDVFTDSKRIFCAVPRQRLEVRNGISIKGKTVYDKELINYARNIAEKSGIFGPCNIQCFRLKDGRVIFTEINARFAGSLIMSICAGCNMSLIAAKLAAHCKINAEMLSFREIEVLRYWSEAVTEPEKGVKGE